MLVQNQQKFYSLDEYRELEETAEFRGESAIVSLASVAVQMSMSEIYAKVVFETDETELPQQFSS
ncbi:hypothetical protein [Tychonema sp. LEGE 07203]|uniref:hypothetical protein n=1 Tax=Tychonema sp. LEGE 07203 TaxID=1828671 RepID=UPI00187FFB3D|nr:hypothetical protein [Tychonema sp. LEGE 07203]MBE9094124.1 hypothetical protein [Tychonema sp. LEGE 07203]